MFPREITFKKALLSLVISLGLISGLTTPAYAFDQRVIDVVELTWTGASRPSVGVNEVRNSLNQVRDNWIAFTSFENSDNAKAIEFVYGKTVPTPVRLSNKFDCEGNNFTTFSNAIRADAYKQLGITDYQDRYLAILVPNAGCIWMGRALVGNVKTKGGTLVLHNNANPFVITHELGHSLGLGHSNLLRCSSGLADGPWSTDCRGVEYGGSIDVMGNVDTNSHLSAYHQWRMGLMESDEIHQSWLNEKITLSASDLKKGKRAIFIKDGKSSYWLEYRRPKADLKYKPGIVLYRSDPPPNSFVESPNPLDSLQSVPGPGVASDIWMLNLDDYVYSSTGRASGSMTLSEAKKFTLQSKNVTISFESSTDKNSILVTIERKKDETPPPLPVLSAPQFWQFPEFPVLQNGYEDAESIINYFEIKKDNEIIKLTPKPEEDFFPTYLAPFNPAPILKVKDLPEGRYELQVRAVDIWGNTSDWSTARKLTIDRGAPTLNSSYRIQEANESSAKITLSELRDPGSGLCETVLINPEGVVVARSAESSTPNLPLNSLSLSANKIQTFDCLGNGLQASFSADYSFIKSADFRRIGKWKAVSENGPAFKCIGKCVAYLSANGTVQIAIGSGSASISVANKEVAKVSASNKSEMRLSSPVNIGKNNRSVRVQGENFTLFGAAKASIQLGPISALTRRAHPEDLSLAEEPQKELAKLGFNSTDFEQGWFVLPMSNGTTLKDPTLDFCAANFVSDQDRAERRQVTASKAGSPYLFLSSEVVRYQNTESAQKALQELKTVAKKCLTDGGGVETGGTFSKYQFIPLKGTSQPYIEDSNSFIAHTVIGEGASARTLLAFYQFNRSYFTGLYVVILGDKPISGNEIDRWTLIAKIFKERLEKI